MENRRMLPSAKGRDLVLAAIPLAVEIGYKNLTGPKVAAAAKVSSHSLINYYFGDIGQFKTQVVEAAIATANLEIIVQALVCNDPAVSSLPPYLKTAAIDKLRAE